MRNRATNQRFPSCETREATAMLPAPSSFPDVELKNTDAEVGSKEQPGRTVRTAVTLLSYLSLPFIAFAALPEPLQPFCLLGESS